MSKNKNQNNNAELATLRAELEAMKIALSEAKSSRKTQKEFSDFFINAKSEYLAYKNLSETKRYFEENCADFLSAQFSERKITSKMFHAMLHKQCA